MIKVWYLHNHTDPQNKGYLPHTMNCVKNYNSSCKKTSPHMTK